MTTGQTKKRAALSLAAVFVAGAALGFAATQFYGSNVGRSSGMTPQQYRAQLLDTLTGRLGLTETQQARVEEILDEIGDRFQSVSDAMKPEMEAIRAERGERIMLVLEPSQRPEYEQILEERKRRREEFNNRISRRNSRR